MRTIEHTAKTLSVKTGRFAVPFVSLRPEGSGAPSLRLIALAALLAVALLAVFIAPAYAAPVLVAPQGTGAGQVHGPEGVAVDPSTGTLYVADESNQRIDEFDSSGHFILAFGFGVSNGAEELQTCTDQCREGTQGSGPGQIRPTAVTIDAATHDLYVADNSNSRIDKFTSSGEFLLSFGEAQLANPLPPLAVDDAGHLWVGDVSRLEEYSSSGTLLSELELAGAGQVQALAVDSSGDFFVRSGTPSGQLRGVENDVPGVREYSSLGAPIRIFDESGHPEAIALTPSGASLYVSDQSDLNAPGTASLAKFEVATGAQTAAFGNGEIESRVVGNAIAIGPGESLYVANGGTVQALGQPSPGPLVLTGSTGATEVGKASASLHAKVNPEGKATTARFQYISEKRFLEDGEAFGSGTEETPEISVGADFLPHEVGESIVGLAPGTAYRFRAIAVNADAPAGVVGEASRFETLPPAAITTSVSDVTATSATVEAEINPLGDQTSYHLEYISEAAFLANGESFAGPDAALRTPIPDVSLGAGEEVISVSQHVQDLEPQTRYFYRVLATNALAPGGFASPSQSFVTQSAVSASLLPDRRAWELVSPPEKRGALILPISEVGLVQAAADGGAITYAATAPTGAQPEGNSNLSQSISVLTASGWVTQSIGATHPRATGLSLLGEEYRMFSDDLSRALLQPFGPFEPTLSAEASEQTPFLRSNFPPGEPEGLCSVACFRPLVTTSNATSGAAFGEESKCPSLGPTHIFCGPIFVGASPDLEHVILNAGQETGVGLTATPGDHGGLYEWSNGELTLVSILPSGTPAQSVTAILGSSYDTNDIVAGAVSADGSRIIWSEANGEHHLYSRDTSTSSTAQLDAVQGGSGSGAVSPQFQAATADGSKVFFTDSQELTSESESKPNGSDLYEYDFDRPEGSRLVDLTPGAELQGSLLAVSPDGGSVFFVANKKLTATAIKGDCTQDPGRSNVFDASARCNLYELRHGEARLVAILSGEDYPDWSPQPKRHVARLSPDGSWLEFMSQQPLIGYDNRDAASGKPDEEVFLYKTESGQLSCVSCNPSGSRPHGAEYGIGGNGSDPNLPLVGGDRVFDGTTWLAANVPGGTPFEQAFTLYFSRALSNGGRLFFNGRDALVPSDTNGTEDVYEFEPASSEGLPTSDSCTTASSTFSPSSGGCVSLISSGTSGEESAFVDASASGDDVFFLTNARLSKNDFDTARDIYDARVDGSESEPPKGVECVGDACQQPAVPPNDATPGSLIFNGAGNVLECPKSKVKKGGRCVKKQQRKAKKRKHQKKKGRKANKRQAKSNQGSGK